MKPVSPCRDCTVRTADCHAACPAYEIYKIEMEDYRQAKQSQKQQSVIYGRTRVRRMKGK